MRVKYLVPGVAVAVAVASPALGAPKTPKPPNPGPAASAVTLGAQPGTVVFSNVTTLSGRVSNAAAGTTLRLEQDTTRPYGDSYKPAGLNTTTKANGMYSIAVKPAVNTQYRVTAQLSPPMLSAPKLVLVRTLVGLRLSDSTPARGRLVRFSGSIFPAHDGATALIQKRGSTGRFVTVARTALRDAGTASSSYSRRVRVFRDGVYRVKLASDADHVNGFSRLRAINVR